MLSTTSIKPGYRPEIDGLRGLAVLSVIAFHAFPSWVPGGFIGVDVFFVISGFLITRLVQEGLQRQDFSFNAFYASRIRRLFPSLLVVLLACLLFGWFALLSDEYKALGKHVAGSSLFIPNFVFWSESGYFDYAADAKPLLHLWSLGIEEQFYLFWPFVLWLGFKYGVSIFRAGVAIFLVSLLLNVVMVQESATAAFFLPMTRIWELLAGCLLACRIGARATPTVSGRADSGPAPLAHHAISIFGLGLLTAGFFLLDQDLHFPGLWALVPVLGASALLMPGNRSWLHQCLLSSRLLVWTGLISFPLYLWHWPLLSFARILEGGRPDWPIRTALVGASFVLACLTYALVERPLRFGRHLPAKTSVLVLVMLGAATLGGAVFLQDGYPARIANQKVEGQLADLKFDLPDSEGWYCGLSSHDSPRCHSAGPDPEVVVMGDSHALMIYPALIERFKAKGQVIGLYGASDGCPPLLNVVIQDQGGDARHCLKKGSEAIARVIADTAIKEVILTSRGPMYTTGKGFGLVEEDQFGHWVLHFAGEEKGVRSNEEVFAAGLSGTLDALLAAGKKVSFLHDVPELGFDIRSCFSFRPLSFGSKFNDPCAVSRKDFEARTEAYRTMVNRILSQRPQIKVIDLAEALCDDAWCIGATDQRLLYIDDDHLSHRGADHVVKRLWGKF